MFQGKNLPRTWMSSTHCLFNSSLKLKKSRLVSNSILLKGSCLDATITDTRTMNIWS